VTPYYQHGGITIYHGDCRDVLPTVCADAVVTDPPYGISYRSGHVGVVARSIAGDETTELRDWLISTWLPRPMATFATWRCVSPVRPRGCLVWHKSAGGMGDLSFPWAPTFEMVWVFGDGWAGHRGDSVLTGRTVVTWNTGPARRVHPHEKPVDVLAQIVAKTPGLTVLDPFMGSGTTLRAAKDLNRRAIGIEIEERYCEIAAKRLEQEVLPLEQPA
jgi:DNA modification methylase